MKYLNFNPISIQSANQTEIKSDFIDLSQIYKVSVQIVIGAGSVDGSVQLQVSNDEIKANYAALEAPTNWSDLGSPVALSTSGNTLIAQQDVCYRALRVVYTSTNALVNTITTVADVASSLNDTYFLLNTSGSNYYVWVNVDSAGTDPMISNRTGIEVDISADDTADTVAGAIRTALSAATEVTVTGATNQIITTDDEEGAVSPAIDGAVPTGFNFASNAPTASIAVKLMALAF